MTEEQQKILARAKVIAKRYECPWDREHIEAIEDFWSIAQSDLRIPYKKHIGLPEEARPN